MKRIPEGQVIAEMTDARRFSELMGRNRIRQKEYRRLAHQVIEIGVPDGGKVLDIGTGPGFVAIEVARLLQGTDCQIVGMDLSKAMLTIATENGAKAGLNSILTWREGDNKAMPFDDGEFDFIVSNDSLHHWDDPLPVLNEIARVLKDDGQCIIHDSKRLQHWWPWMFVKTISLTIPRDFRIHWWNSIKSSYTLDELQTMLKSSRWTGWRVGENFMDLVIIKETNNA